MYKSFENKKYRISFSTFNKRIKNSLPPITDVYKTGIRNWKADDSYNYSLVIGTFRIIFSIKREVYTCCR